MIIKNSVIDANWTLEHLDDMGGVIATYSAHPEWLKNFADAIAKGAPSPLGDWGYDAIKFGSGNSPTVDGMDGIERVVDFNQSAWPQSSQSNTTLAITYNSSTGYYTKTSTEVYTLSTGAAGDFLPGTVISEVGGAFDYSYNSYEYTDGSVMLGQWLPAELSTDLYSFPRDKYNPLCANRGIVKDSNELPSSITLLDGHQLRCTIITSIEFKLDPVLDVNTAVYDQVTGMSEPTTISFAYIPYTDPASFIAHAPLGPVCSTAWIGAWRLVSSVGETNENWIPFVYNVNTNKFIIDPTTYGFSTSFMSDVAYMEITDWNSITNDELVLARMTFDPPLPSSGDLLMDLQFSRFVEPKYPTVTGSPPVPVFTDDPNLTLLPNWGALRKTFSGKNIKIITNVETQTVTIIHNTTSYDYSYASGISAPVSNIELKIRASSPASISMSQGQNTIGYYAPVFDDTVYTVAGPGAVNTIVTLTMRDRDNINNFREEQIILDVARPTYDPMSTGPFLTVVSTSSTSTSITCTDLSNYSIVPTTGATATDAQRVAYSPDGLIAAVGYSSSPFLRIFDASTWEEIPVAIPPVITGGVASMDFSPDGSLLCVGHSASPFYAIFRTNDWTTVTKPSISGTAQSVKFSNSGSMLAIGHSGGKRISVINTSTWTAIGSLPTLSSTCASVDWNSTDTRLALIFWASPYLRVLDTATWAAVAGTPNVSSSSTAVAYDNSGNNIAVLIGSEARIISTIDWTTVKRIYLPGSALQLQFNPAGTLLGVVHESGNLLTLINTATWTPIADTTWIDSEAPFSIAFRP